MAGIQSLGVGSGLLTSELVDQLVAADRAVSDLRLDSNRHGSRRKFPLLRKCVR